MEPEINLRATLDCGQVFHWRERPDGGWEGLIGGAFAAVRQEGSGLRILRGDPVTVARYFSMDHDLEAIYAGFPQDATMLAALDFCRGLRMIRQPAWECLATFITSSMKQVAHIRQMSHALRARFGRAVRGTDLRSYPEPSALAAATEDELRACGLGYRAKNLRATAQRVASGEADLGAWRGLEDTALGEALCGLPGVGRKVANCVMLFGFERLKAFPVDTWIARILQKNYWRGRQKPTPLALERRLARRFGPHAGYAQQYLFHHGRMTQRMARR
ncbi:MAG: DNA glycosylase [Chthoniobacterales bacterium]